MALIRMCVVPNCSQRLSQPILWIMAVCATYWTHSTAVSLNGRVNPPSASHPPPPPPSHPRHFTPTRPPLIHAICDITVTVKKVSQKPAVLAS